MIQSRVIALVALLGLAAQGQDLASELLKAFPALVEDLDAAPDTRMDDDSVFSISDEDLKYFFDQMLGSNEEPPPQQQQQGDLVESDVADEEAAGVRRHSASDLAEQAKEQSEALREQLRRAANNDFSEEIPAMDNTPHDGDQVEMTDEEASDVLTNLFDNLFDAVLKPTLEAANEAAVEYDAEVESNTRMLNGDRPAALEEEGQQQEEEGSLFPQLFDALAGMLTEPADDEQQQQEQEQEQEQEQDKQLFDALASMLTAPVEDVQRQEQQEQQPFEFQFMPLTTTVDDVQELPQLPQFPIYNDYPVPLPAYRSPFTPDYNSALTPFVFPQQQIRDMRAAPQDMTHMHAQIPADHQPMMLRLDNKDGFYVITGWFPGVSKEDMKVSLNGDALHITAVISDRTDTGLTKGDTPWADVVDINEDMELPYKPAVSSIKAHFDSERHTFVAVMPMEQTNEIELQ